MDLQLGSGPGQEPGLAKVTPGLEPWLAEAKARPGARSGPGPGPCWARVHIGHRLTLGPGPCRMPWAHFGPGPLWAQAQNDVNDVFITICALKLAELVTAPTTVPAVRNVLQRQAMI